MGPLAIVCDFVGEESWICMVPEQDDTERYVNGENILLQKKYGEKN
jgi:hypothetical protein